MLDQSGDCSQLTGPAHALRRGWLIALLAALLLYCISVAPGALWQDNGMAQVRVLRADLHGELGLALSHPLYYVLAIAFQLLPLSSAALKTNLVSAVFGALTVANVYLLLRLLDVRTFAAAAGAAGLAVAHTFWQHAAMAEVYTVSTTLLVVELLCAVQFVRTRRPAWLVLLALAGGLGVSNHNLALLNLPVWGIWAAWLLWKRRLSPAWIPAWIAAWLAGAGLYLFLIGNEFTAGRPAAEVLASALFGDQYARNVLNLRVGFRLLARSLLYLGLNFPTPAALLILIGAAQLRRIHRPIGVILGGLLAIHLLWAARYNVPDQYTFFIPAIVLLAVLLGLGAEWLLTRSTRWHPALAIAVLLPALVYTPLPTVARAANLPLGLTRAIPHRDEYTYFLQPWKTAYRGPARFAEEALATLPPNGVLVGDGTTLPPVHYALLTDDRNGNYPARLRHTVSVWPPVPGRMPPGTYWPQPADVADALARGDLYVVTPQPGYCPAWLLDAATFELVGVLHRAIPRAPQ